MFKKEKDNKSDSKKDNFLLYVPKIKHTDYEIEDDKVTLLFYHNKAAEKFVRWLVKKPYVSDIKLDEVCSNVWRLIDGKRTVYEIGQELLNKFGDSCQPVYDRLIMYLRYLLRKGWIAFDEVKKKEELEANDMDLNKRIDGMRDELIQSTQEVLKIKSVEGEAKPGMPFGEGVGHSLECALQICEKLGFKTVNLDGYVGYAEYGESEDYIGILGHLDVVPEGDGWIHPPYAAEIHDGKIYARGAMDDKGPIIAALYGLKAIKDSAAKLSKRVRIIFGTNEETGSKEIEYYLKTEKPPIAGFTPDAEYPIIYAEKGITIFNLVKDLKVKASGDIVVKYIKGGQRPNMVPDYCEAGIYTKAADTVVKAVNDFSAKTSYKINAEVKDGLVIVKSVGVSAHGSLPQLGKNAIMQMFEFLETLELSKCDMADAVAFMNKNIGMDVYGEKFGVGLEDKASGKLSFTLGVIEMNEDKLTVALNLRYPVTFKLADMMNPFNARIEGTGFRIEDFEHQEPLYFPEDHSLIKSLQKVYTEQTGKEATLLAIGGGTYAKEMPNIVAFGPIFPGEPDLDHQANEYIGVENLVLNAKIYAHAIYELAK